MEDFEIIIADHGSTDRSPEIARQFGARVVSLPSAKTVAELRNGAAAVARGKWLVFTDADCVPGEDWFEIGLSRVRSSDIIGAHYRIADDAHWSARTWYDHDYLMAGPVVYVPSSNLWIAAALFKEVNGFRGDLASAEDSDLCARIWQAGGQTVAEPSLAVVHLGAERSLGQFFRRQLWHGRETLRVFLDTPHAGNVRALVIAVFFLLAGGGALAAALARKPILFGIFCAALLAGSFAMALRRHTPLHLLPQSVVLCFLYGVARAACLVAMGTSRSPRKAAGGKV